MRREIVSTRYNDNKKIFKIVNPLHPNNFKIIYNKEKKL